MANAPKSLTIRAYQVGFGDCFLLGFEYARATRFILIDFGSTGLPRGSRSDHMLEVARDIERTCGGKLHAVVATHRHRDHISGFATGDGKKSGDVIRSLNPDVVVQPWTEDPKARVNAKAPAVGKRSLRFAATLNDMQSFAAIALRESQTWPARTTSRREVEFLGETNLTNLSAVKNLMTMGGERRYVYYGARSGLVLPGVKVQVLGPPTLEQTETIRTQTARDPDEFWHLRGLAARLKEGGLRAGGFSTPLVKGNVSITSRWLADRLQKARRAQLREIVRSLDDALNNTSVILLFEVGGKKFLFPGDAQIENWSYALSHPSVRKRLEGVDVYKVGHHGSLNATPKSLWNAFERRSKSESQKDRLVTFLSTMPGKHGDTKRKTEVPRKPLVQALSTESTLLATTTLKSKELFVEHRFEL